MIEAGAGDRRWPFCFAGQVVPASIFPSVMAGRDPATQPHLTSDLRVRLGPRVEPAHDGTGGTSLADATPRM